MKHFYTDGIKTIKLEDGQPIPEGFKLGRTFKVNTWNKGLTKETDERVKSNCEKCHKTRKEKHNYKSWNRGLTKDTNTSLKTVSEKMSIYRQNNPFTEEQIKQMNEHIYKTKKKNHSFNSSSPEEKYYAYLLTLYDREDIVRQYKDERYPFNCDFYIKSKDLFIELNFSWVHGGHPFNENDVNDINILNIKLEKAKNSNYHKYAIKVWTEYDVNKLYILRKNRLNFMLIYPNDLIIDK